MLGFRFADLFNPGFQGFWDLKFHGRRKAAKEQDEFGNEGCLPGFSDPIQAFIQLLQAKQAQIKDVGVNFAVRPSAGWRAYLETLFICLSEFILVSRSDLMNGSE